jgi:hypothetical protein
MYIHVYVVWCDVMCVCVHTIEKSIVFENDYKIVNENTFYIYLKLFGKR